MVIGTKIWDKTCCLRDILFPNSLKEKKKEKKREPQSTANP